MSQIIKDFKQWYNSKVQSSIKQTNTQECKLEEKLKYVAMADKGETRQPTMDTAAYDFSKMMRLTKSIQTHLICQNCKQTYLKKWCKDEICLFCTHYLPMRDTYFSILRDIDWQFLKSGESDREVFYNDFLDNLEKWSQRFHVLPTKQDLKEVEELRKVQNWTRDYWH